MADTNLMRTRIDEAEEHLFHAYNRYQVVFERGEGVHLIDINGKRYLDFVAGIAVNSLGYHYPGFDEALHAQVDKLLHTSNYYYTEILAEAAGKLTKASGMARVFFGNSGAEAVEGALKAARKYAFLRDGHTDHEIIAMEHSFHGRTLGALSVTGNEAYRAPFEPLIGGVVFANYNDFGSVKAAVTDKTCAIILETVQGEGGVHPADEAFLKDIRALCDERDILLILDEIQCGMGRTGTMFAFEQYGIMPDILCVAKAIGNGVPVGAFLMNERVAETSLKPGDHGTTYGGNPLAACAVAKTLDLFREDHIIENVRSVGEYLAARLDGMVREHGELFTARRGRGLLQGLECRESVAGIITRAMENGLLLINAGPNVLRFVPPLIITKKDVDDMTGILERSLHEERKP